MKMTTKCPKCGDTKLVWKKDSANYCPACMTYWTDWQQAKIEELEAELIAAQKREMRDIAEIDRLRVLLKEIEEHPHCNSGVKCEFLGEMFDDLPTYKPAYEAGANRGHRCAAAIAARARKEENAVSKER
jgi:uncharacterized Zn finger protein (UPF0148 family)